jgi:CheY-like chemotaxis protein
MGGNVNKLETRHRNKKILIVDDDADFRSIMDDILTDEGFITVEASDGAMAVGSFLLNQPDLVLLDYQMPSIDGFAALTHMKQTKPAVPVIVMTGTLAADIARQAILKGADEIMFKPPDFKELIAHIKKWLFKKPVTG